MTPLKRLSKELAEIEAEGDALPFRIHPLEENFLLWHFTLRGPAESEYSEGEYHGKISFPSDYPFAPPSVVFLTPSGRFDVNMKICLSFTGYHPEQWQPAWGVRTMLLALREHFRVEDKAAVGYLGQSRGERQRAAQRAALFVCRDCGYNAEKCPERRKERRCQLSQGILVFVIIAVATVLIAHSIN